MEGKERYVIRYDLDYNRCLIDTEKNQGVGDYIRIVKLLNQQDKRIKELEQENLSLQEQSIRDNQNWIEETTQLKQQLAEKTLTIEQINKAFIENRSLWKGRYEQSNQDKISFAVKQLEKLKKEFNERKLEYITMETKTHIYGLRIDRINELIDNQINGLKGEV